MGGDERGRKVEREEEKGGGGGRRERERGRFHIFDLSKFQQCHIFNYNHFITDLIIAYHPLHK